MVGEKARKLKNEDCRQLTTLVMFSSYTALGIFTTTHNLGSYLGKESFKRDTCILTQSLQEALRMVLQIGVDVGLPKNIQKLLFLQMDISGTEGILILPSLVITPETG